VEMRKSRLAFVLLLATLVVSHAQEKLSSSKPDSSSAGAVWGQHRLGAVHLGMTSRTQRDYQEDERLSGYAVMHDDRSPVSSRSSAAPAKVSISFENPLSNDPTRLSKPEVIGHFGLHGSVRPVLMGGFAATLAQVSTSSKDVERSRGTCPAASCGTCTSAAAQVAANSAGVRSSSAE